METSKNFTPIENLNREKFDLPALTAFRRWMHENAELSWKEFNTQKKIKEYLLKIGIPEADIKICAKTGFSVEIWGKGPPKGDPEDKKIIGFRSDHDALPMEELTGLSYTSKTEAAHMCGHDGHTTCNLGGASLFMSNLEHIPCNRAVRLIFQPAEEGCRGASLMIKEGVLENLNEIYGMHVLPNPETETKIKISEGVMMAHILIYKFRLVGRGGHGSTPENCLNPLPCAARLYLKVKSYLSEFQREHKIRYSLTSIQGGKTFNIIPDDCLIQGTIRLLDLEDQEIVKKEIEKICKEVTESEGITLELECKEGADGPVINKPECAKFVEKQAKIHFGEKRVDDEGVPIFASEDFADFLFRVPGAFYFVVLDHLEKGVTLHSSKFNFDDRIIEQTSELWYRIIVERLKEI